MLRRTNIMLVIATIVVLVATWVMLGGAVAQKAAAPKAQDKLALGASVNTQKRPYKNT